MILRGVDSRDDCDLKRVAEFLGEVLSSEPECLDNICVMRFDEDPGWNKVGIELRGEHIEQIMKQIEKMLPNMKTYPNPLEEE